MPSKNALATIFRYMYATGDTLEETVLKHLDELNSEAPFDYITLVKNRSHALLRMYDVVVEQLKADGE
jgi:hypothetical protein